MSTYSQLQDGNYSTVKRNVRTTPSQTGNLEQGDGTPTAVGAYIQSEPRNYAPRTVGAEAPPRFALSTKVGRARGPSFASIAEEDVFGAGSVNTERALVVSAPETPQRALVPLNPGPVPPMIQALRSDMLNFLTNNPSGLPDIQLALDPRYFPFIESSSQSSPPQHGVIKIKNIPFATKRAEVIAFLGRNSKILNDTQEPVHIIMERVTSKTQDAYVEFISLNDAMKAVEKIEHIQQRGRLPRLGDRPVDVELSSQSALMEDLFPHATGVFWEGCKPRFRPQKEDEPWNHFKGFVSEEEMTMLVKHVEIPLRSPFSRDCPQRPYECMISTIKKLPWWRADCITIRQRHAVYSATLQLLKLLRASIGRLTTNETCINTKLLKRLYTAAMLCPGFSVLQKDNLSFEMNEPDGAQRDFNQPRFPDHWTHLLALGPKPGVPLDVLEFYIAIIREETCRHFQRKPLRERAEIDGIHLYTNGYFGYLWQEIGFPRPGEEYDNMTLRTASSNELSAIERVLTRAFYRG
ncbi:hypothetical protein B0T17DRAFT_499849 [Bombardia bombarda]|uniref:RRM domain-containing protein n=1 Tax=Bombardia bombarda TaxID=252184 RepID=A0AA39T267_9PEZI|nr:hypothetical protein B0T17DRAFT_499849 [Bombardia bombarda]